MGNIYALDREVFAVGKIESQRTGIEQCLKNKKDSNAYNCQNDDQLLHGAN